MQLEAGLDQPQQGGVADVLGRPAGPGVDVDGVLVEGHAHAGTRTMLSTGSWPAQPGHSRRMNGWADPEPAWWRNLQAQPEATVELVGATRAVRARAAQGAEQSRLWARWSEIDRHLDAYAAMRSSPTAVVILEPRPASP